MTSTNQSKRVTHHDDARGLVDVEGLELAVHLLQVPHLNGHIYIGGRGVCIDYFLSIHGLDSTEISKQTPTHLNLPPALLGEPHRQEQVAVPQVRALGALGPLVRLRLGRRGQLPRAGVHDPQGLVLAGGGVAFSLWGVCGGSVV